MEAAVAVDDRPVNDACPPSHCFAASLGINHKDFKEIDVVVEARGNAEVIAPKQAIRPLNDNRGEATLPNRACLHWFLPGQ